MSETVIRIDNLKKKYRLGTIGGGTLSADLQSWWARKRGKEDPNTLIGTKLERVGEYFYALDGINLEVKKGEALGVIGANGAGKSTLLKILSRVTAPTEGEVKIKGRVASMLEVGTGFHPELTGRENIYMNGAILGMTKEEIDSKIEEIIDFSECRQFIDTPVKRYSSGMYVKLAFSVAAHLDAEIMIMDEVLAVGDMKFQKKCLSKMDDSAHNEGKTILYVSHNMDTIRKLCTRVIVLNKGKIIFDGPVEEGIQKYLDDEKKELRTKYELEDTKRPSVFHGSVLKIKKLEFVNNGKVAFNSSEEIKFRITFESKERIEDLRLNITFRDADTDSLVGTTQSECFECGNPNEEFTREFSLLLDNLVEGTYSFYVDVFVRNEYGTHLSYDHPLQKMFVQLINSEDGTGIRWQKKYYGNVMLNPIRNA